MTSGDPTPTQALVLVTGHESRGVDGLAEVAEGLADRVVVCGQRVVHHRVGALVAEADVVSVVPMTWGRDPVLVADTAKALQWFAAEPLAGASAGRVALCDSLGTPDHLVAHLRRATRRVAVSAPGAGVLLTAPGSNPFDDAELYRLAHLVRTHGAGVEVEVALLRAGREDQDLGRALERCRRLGQGHVVVVPAGLARTCAWCEEQRDVDFHGPVVSDAALARTLADRVARARHRLQHGDDGIAVGLLADDGHGYAHSHAVEGHGHEHAHHRASSHLHENAAPQEDHHHTEHEGHEVRHQGHASSPRRETDTTSAVRQASEV